MAKCINNISGIVYRLKRDFGVPVIYVELGIATTNKATGVISQSQTNYTIRQVIVLEAKDIKQYIPAEQMKHVGFLDISTRGFIIDKQDISFPVKIKDWLRYDSKRYEISGIHTVAETKSMLVIAKASTQVPIMEE